MTTASVSQVGAEVLYRVIPAMRASQVGAEYLHTVIPGVKVSQVGIEYLHRVLPSISISQVGTEFLFKSLPCGTRLAQIWTITRVDGEIRRFTSLDRDLEWPPTNGQTFKSCTAPDPSAAENVAEVDSAGSMDLSGAVGTGPTAIERWDLYAGLYDGARLEAWLVPWDGNDTPKLLLSGTFGAVNLTETGYKVELVGDGERMKQTPLVDTLKPGCRWQFGDDRCQKDLGPLTVTGTVDEGEGVRDFTDAARAESAGYFTRGRVTFTGGANAGISAEIKEHAAGGVFTLWPRLPFPISAGDTYSMTPGCSLLKASALGTNGCTAWANETRYGGFDKVPGGDKRNKAADVRTQ